MLQEKKEIRGKMEFQVNEVIQVRHHHQVNLESRVTRVELDGQEFLEALVCNNLFCFNTQSFQCIIWTHCL